MIKISFTINDDQTHNEHAQVKYFLPDHLLPERSLIPLD